MMRKCVYLERIPNVIGVGLYVGAEDVGDAVDGLEVIGVAVVAEIKNIIISYLSKYKYTVFNAKYFNINNIKW